MPEIGTSGLMSGDGKRGDDPTSVPAPILDSTAVPALLRGLVAGRSKRPDESGRGTLDHGIDALVNLSWISLTTYLRHWSCARHAVFEPVVV
jgi:hypothetical protein